MGWIMERLRAAHDALGAVGSASVGAAAVIGAGFVTFAAAGIDHDDIAADQRVSTAVTASAYVRAVGEIVATSPDGQRSPQHVCSYALADDGEILLKRVYFNRLSHFLKDVVRSEITFDGRLTELSDLKIKGFVEDCDPCELARRVNRRETLCLSEKLLEEGAQPIAARFRRDAMRLEPEFFEWCGLEFSPAAKAQAQSCPLHEADHFVTELRSFLGVIDYRTVVDEDG